jgi:putative nucleotidyltransferase with HDIG domain
MISFELFKSKFAYRIFLLFIFSAIVPLLLLSFISFYQVSHQLIRSSQDRLHHQAITLGMSMIERCVFAEDEIELISAYYKTNRSIDLPRQSPGFDQYFSAVSVASQNGSSISDILGNKKDWPALSSKLKRELAEGKTVLFTVSRSNTSASIFMYKTKKENSGKELTFLTEIRPYFLLGILQGHEDSFGDIGVSIVEKGRVIFTTLPQAQAAYLHQRVNAGKLRDLYVFEQLVRNYLISSVPVFLESRLNGPLWSLVMTEPTADVFKPVKSFKVTFILVILLAFVVIVLISTNQIRRYLVPLERLQQGTIKISQGDLKSRVIINSGDEFEDLAGSFNTMITRIDQQFNTLQTMTDIDRAILTEFDFESIIYTFITRISDLCPCDAAGVCFRYLSSDERWISHYRTIPSHALISIMEMHTLNNDDLVFLYDKSECLISAQDSNIPKYLASLVHKDMTSFLVMPITLNTHMMAIVFLAARDYDFSDKEHQTRARQITDRVAVALSNAYLINELKTLNWGTITALARVVDAKSPWTAGHSERVAAIALRIGKSMELSEHQLDVLNKAGMLHDIGKVSTPRAILDKNGKLTNDEFAIIQEHTERGARILEPISSYAEMIPIVLQHHERFDGKGYPGRLAGHMISLGARILAVADTFDAMTSDRPYRPGMEVSFVLQEISKEAGRQFDPDVVQAFLKVMSENDLNKECA